MNPIEKKNFYLYMSGELVSLIGSGIQMIAVPLYILDVTGSGTMTGIFTFLNLVPTLLMSPLAGVLGDRWNRKKIMVSMDFARGALLLILFYLANNFKINLHILFTFQVFISLMDSIFNSSTQAMLPELVNEDNLMKANSILASINSISWIIGPILGGVVYGFGGIKLVFLLNGCSFIISSISELFIEYTSTMSSEKKITFKLFIIDFKEGFYFIKNSKNLLTLLIFFSLGNFLISAGFFVVIPFALRKTIGFTAKEYGIIEATFTIGILLGNIILGSILIKRKVKLLVQIGLAGMTITNLFFAITLFPSVIRYFGGSSFILLTIISFERIIMGIFNALLNTTMYTNFQKLIHNKLRSRVFSVMGIFTQGGVPLGAVIYGVLLDLFPVHIIYLYISILITLRTFIFLFKAPNGVFEPTENKEYGVG